MQRIKKSLIWLVIVSTIIIYSAVEGLCGELRIDDCVWNSNSQSFNMKLSTKAGKVSVDKLKGYRIRSEIKISHGTRTTPYTLRNERNLDTMTRVKTSTKAITRTDAPNIPWDRGGSDLTGAVRARTRTRAITRTDALSIPWDTGGNELTGAVRARTRTRAVNRISALNIPWDRGGGNLTGAVRATVTVLLLDSSGTVVDKASYTKTMRVW